MNEPIFPEKRRDHRQFVHTSTNFYVDANVVGATSEDFSGGGIRLKTEKSLRMVMKVDMGDYQDERVADLIWARRNELGQMEYGLQYLPEYCVEPMAATKKEEPEEEKPQVDEKKDVFPPYSPMLFKW